MAKKSVAFAGYRLADSGNLHHKHAPHRMAMRKG